MRRRRTPRRRSVFSAPPDYVPTVVDRKTIADNAKVTVGKYFKKKMRAVFCELGLCSGGRLRADIFVLAMNGYAVIVEVKSSVADFRGDKKMEQYLGYCNQAYLAVPKKVYLKIKDDVPEGFGVFILTDDGRYITKVVRSPKGEIEEDVVFNLAIRAAFRNSDLNTTKNKRL